MRYPGRVTICISSQAGCGMNCPFCATGQAGPDPQHVDRRDRRAGRRTRPGRCAAASSPAAAEDAPLRVSNVVFMGMGEALANYKAAIGAIRRLTDPAPDGLGMSARGITMSTVGLVPAIDKLAAEGIPVTLALSLHAPDDELRNELVPINTRWKVDEALDAAHRYYEATGRRVSIEYALIRDINDQAWRADLLGDEAQRPRPRLGARQPDPAQPDAGLEVDRLAQAASSSSSSSGCARTASRRRSATPGARRSTAPAASWPPPPPERVADGAGSAAQQRERLVR